MTKNSPRRNYPLRSRGRRRGVTIVFFAFSLVVFLGMTSLAVDYGLAVSDANAMQRASDAAALAGATKLVATGTDSNSIATDTGNARTFAKVVAARNGVTVTDGDVTFTSYNKIRVQASRTRQYLFARMLGFQSGQVTRHAVCKKVALSGITTAVPLAMTLDDYNANKGGGSFEYNLIDNHNTAFSPGTLTALDLRPNNNGKSPSVFEGDLDNGYDGTVTVGEQMNALNASLASEGPKLDSAMQDRISDAAAASYADTGSNYTYPNYPPDDRRIMFLIVANPTAADNSNPMITALFFVPVYVESTSSPDGHKSEAVRFRILPGYTFNSQNPDIILDSNNAPTAGISAIVMTSE